MHHPNLHLQPTEVMTGETTSKMPVLSTSQQRSCESPIISQQGLCVLVDLAHVLRITGRHDCVRLCMWLSHTAEIHAPIIIHPFSLSDQLSATPLQEQISFWIQGSRMVSEGGRLLIQSNRFILPSIQKDTTSQSETNERGVVPSSTLIQRKIKEITCLQWIPKTKMT